MHIHLVKAAFGGVERLLSSFLSVMKTQEEEDGGSMARDFTNLCSKRQVNVFQASCELSSNFELDMVRRAAVREWSASFLPQVMSSTAKYRPLL